jgi:hypothetical protein
MVAVSLCEVRAGVALRRPEGDSYIIYSTDATTDGACRL